MARQLRSPRFNNVLDVPGVSGTVTNSSQITGQLRVSLNPALSDGYAEPIQQPLRKRVPQRQQVSRVFPPQVSTTVTNTSTVTGQLRVASNPGVEPTWKQPTSQPLRSRVPKRLQLPRIQKSAFLVTTTSSATLGGQLRVSTDPSLNPVWIRPTNQPLRSRVPRRLQLPRVSKASFLVSVLNSTTIGGQLRISSNPSLEPVWVHPTHQPLRSRVPKRLQVNRVDVGHFLITRTGFMVLNAQLRVSANPALQPAYKHLIEQPLRNRIPRRQQVSRTFVLVLTATTPSATITGQLRIAEDPSTNPLWVRPTNQPLKSRVPKRLQVNRVTKDKFLVTASSSTTLTGQLRVALNPSTTAGWKQSVNEPLRSRVPKRQQPAYPTFRFLVSTVPATTIGAQLRVSANPALEPVWKQPTNQPLKARVPKRLQLPRPTKGAFLATVSSTTTIGGQLRVSTNPALVPVWKQPVNEPLKSRVPKRQQPVYPSMRFLTATASSTTIGGQLRISINPAIEPLWKQPTNQPLRRRVPKRLQVNRVLRGDFLVTSSTNTTVTGQLRIAGNPSSRPTLWKQPVNQPLRKRVPKRQMPKSIPSKFLPLQTITVTSTITGRLRIIASTSLWVPEGNPTNAFQGSTDTTSALWQNQGNPSTGFTGNANPSSNWQQVNPETLEWH